jgi:DNA-binding response OmpR family regulator
MKPKMKIVVVEDEPAIQEMYRMKLKMSDFDVKTANNGEEGLAVIDEFEPHLILLDIKMPVMSGDVMLEQLRQTEKGAQMRVIILTNISRDEAPHNLRLLHVDRYIVKAHYTPTQVIQVVQEVLGIK